MGAAVSTSSNLGAAGAKGLGALARTAPVPAGRHRQAPQASMGAGQPAFQHVAHVGQWD